MDRYINCIADGTSEGNLLLGDRHTALFDCGMMSCAGETVRNVKKALAGRTLDYIFMSHCHYDHIGALLFFRAEWPRLRLVTGQTGAETPLKETPRRVIREMSLSAARVTDPAAHFEYDEDAFRADITVREGDAVPLGGVTVFPAETPGHTRDSLSFHVPELKLLILCETPGVFLPDGTMHPCYLTGYRDTMMSIEKCRRLGAEVLSFPHRGIVPVDDTDAFFDGAAACNNECYEFILSMRDRGFSVDEMVDAFAEKYGRELILALQPLEAFTVNARATIACTLRG